MDSNTAILIARYALTALAREDRPRWDKNFSELGRCLSIDCATISADDLSDVTAGV